jgi:hypothetical protein
MTKKTKYLLSNFVVVFNIQGCFENKCTLSYS